MEKETGDGVVNSLLDISIRCIVVNMRQIEDMIKSTLRRGQQPYIDTWIMLKVLKPISARPLSNLQLTCLEWLSPCLIDDGEVDQLFWKAQVENKFNTRVILYPFPDLVEYVRGIKNCLISDTITEEECLTKLRELTPLPFSTELGKQTGIGVTVSKLSKKQDQSATQSLALRLMRKWKAIHRLEIGDSVETSTCETVSHDAQLATKSPQISTWRSLYYFCEQEEEEQFQRVSQRISEKVKCIRETKRTAQSAALGTLSDQQKKKMVRLDMSRASSSVSSNASQHSRHKVPQKSSVKIVNAAVSNSYRGTVSKK